LNNLISTTEKKRKEKKRKEKKSDRSAEGAGYFLMKWSVKPIEFSSNLSFSGNEYVALEEENFLPCGLWILLNLLNFFLLNLDLKCICFNNSKGEVWLWLLRMYWLRKFVMYW